MKITHTISKLFQNIAIAILTIVNITNTFCQDTKLYSGNYNSRNYQGKANYEYFEDSSNTRYLNGKFQFKSNEENVKIEGQFHLNKKNGFWKFDIKPSLNLLCNVNAVSFGNFENGQLFGKWEIKRLNNSIWSQYHELNNSGYISEHCIANFKDNHFIDTFKLVINKNEITINGIFNKEGYFDGIWKISFNKNKIQYLETITYYKGVMLKLTIKDLSTGVEDVYFDETEKILTLFKNYNDEKQWSKYENKYYILNNNYNKTDGYRYSSIIDDALSTWLNDNTINNSSYTEEIELGSIKMKLFPERHFEVNERISNIQSLYEQAELAKRKSEIDSKTLEQINQNEAYKTSQLGIIKEDIKKDFNNWSKKTAFETEKEFENRIKNESEAYLKKISLDKINLSMSEALAPRYATLGEYNVIDETFSIYYEHFVRAKYSFTNINKTKDTAYIKVPKNIAQVFQLKFETKKGERDGPIFVIPIDVYMTNNNWKASKAIILIDNFWFHSFPEKLIEIKGFKTTINNNKFEFVLDEYELRGRVHNVPFQNRNKTYSVTDISKINKIENIYNEVYYYNFQVEPINRQSLDFTVKDFE